MKKQVLFLSLLVAFIGTIFQANAQSRNTEVADFVAAAKEAKGYLDRLVPTLESDREAVALVPVFKAANDLATRVGRAGSKMTTAQYEGFQRELGKIIADVDQLPGDPRCGPACREKCEEKHGTGYGGGKGWKRFWCKAGCLKIKIKIGPVEVESGGC